MQLRDAAETLGAHYQTAYGWVRQGTLPARKTAHGYEVSESDVRDLMAAACLRADHWQVHHLAADLPVAEVTGFAADTGASLIVLSSATTGAARLASREAREIGEHLPHARILAGRPGDTLSHLRKLARTPLPAVGR